MNQMTLFTPSVRRLLADPFFGPLELSRVFAPMANSAHQRPSRPTWKPLADIRDSGGEIRIDVELPGIRREDLSVRCHDGRLAIEGRRSDAARTPETTSADEAANGSDDASVEVQRDVPAWSRRERFHGVFRRTFNLPDTVDVSRIQARTSNGILTIVLPKLEKAQPREIEVQVH